MTKPSCAELSTCSTSLNINAAKRRLGSKLARRISGETGGIRLRIDSEMTDLCDHARTFLSGIAENHNLQCHQVENDFAALDVRFFDPSKSEEILSLNLQNHDEIHLHIGDFWAEWFPYPQVSEKIETALRAWLNRSARIVHHYRGDRLLKITMEVPNGDGWETVFSHYKTVMIPFFSNRRTYKTR